MAKPDTNGDPTGATCGCLAYEWGDQDGVRQAAWGASPDVLGLVS